MNILRFFRAKEGTTAVEFGLLAAPVILLIVGVMEFSLLLWKMSALDNAALELHKSVRMGAANSQNYRTILCDRAGSIIDCVPERLLVEVRPLPQQALTGSVSEGFNASVGEAFLLRVAYRHSFVLQFLNMGLPGRLLSTQIIMYGEVE